jgi:ElaB/YqjD/DUF883 family membrane-anchored ribosome-binding protein
MEKARNVARNASESARSFGRSAFQASNLLPAALIGAGVYWLRRNWGEGGNGYEYEQETDERHGEYRYMGSESIHGSGSAFSSEGSPGYGYEETGNRVASQGYYGEHPAESMTSGEQGGEGLRSALERAREGAADLKERAGELASQAGERVRQTSEQVRERAGRYVDRTGSELRRFQSTARHRSRQLWDEGGRLMSDHPLEATGIFFAVGVLAGLLIPSTRREDDILGEVRDDVLERAKETGRETIEKLQNVGQETMESAKVALEREGLADRGTIEKAQHTAGKAIDQSKSAAERTADQVKGSAGKAVDAGRSAAQTWDPTRTGPEGQNKPGSISSAKDKGFKSQDVKTEHDIKIKKE